ncbi:MAG: hypothetical protein WCK17_12640 [Verrucomicrobiota bacterium]
MNEPAFHLMRQLCGRTRQGVYILDVNAPSPGILHSAQNRLDAPQHMKPKPTFVSAFFDQLGRLSACAERTLGWLDGPLDVRFRAAQRCCLARLYTN